ncbi:transposase, partial [Microbispora bryophytorum]|uniref:transposase n=1 Tax=Microbispora bryophytorum TaxID=1460882 RepID=UPI0037188885
LLRDQGVCVIEVDRPDRKTRRFQGKSDPIDAISAAKTALAGERTGTPKQRDGRIEAVRNLRVARRSAVDQRADAQRQIKALIVTAPDDLRERLRGLPVKQLISTCAGLRPDQADTASPATAAKIALRSLARRHQRLSEEIDELDALLDPLVTAINPRLVAANGVGTDVAGQLLVTAGENHERLTSEAAFAMLCGAAPIPASSGKTTAPPQPWRRPPSQQSPLPRCHLPSALGPTHPRLHGTTHQRRTLQKRDHPLPQTLRRPRALPDHHHTK